MMCLNPTFRWGPNLSFFGLGPWAIIHGIAKLANTFYLSNMNFDDTILKGLFLKHKIFDIGSTELSYGSGKSLRTIDQMAPPFGTLSPTPFPSHFAVI